jgi:Ni,Fe-hydrogenase I small subunit
MLIQAEAEAIPVTNAPGCPTKEETRVKLMYLLLSGRALEE